MGTARAGPGRARCGAMAPGRSRAGDRGKVRRRYGRAQHQHRAAPARFPAAGSSPSPSRSRRGRTSVFQSNFAAIIDAALPEHARGKTLELWWQDEARIGQQGTLTRVWGERGSRPAAPRDQRYSWAYLFGAICPARGCGAALVLPFANADMMNLHLAEISTCVAPEAHAVLVIDGAGWQQTGDKLRVPGNITLLQLPPYSPELNPVENIWAYLRSNKLSNRVFETYDAIVDACCTAWLWLTAQPERITSIGTRDWARVTQ